jgi:hypothetical protein
MKPRQTWSSSGRVERSPKRVVGRMAGLLLCVALCAVVLPSAAAGQAPTVPALPSPALACHTTPQLPGGFAGPGGIVPAGTRSMLSAGGDVPAGMDGSKTQASNRQAFVPALMSAVLPGSGQLRNGSVIKGVAFAAVELTGWMAWFSFRHQESEKYDDIESFGDRYWNYARYHRVAPNPDSCGVYECPCDFYTPEADSLILVTQEQGGDRFYDYLARDAYACGWDSPLSRDLYLDLQDDREDLLDAKRLTGRLIFLNHVVSAVDAFLQARRVRVAGFADVGLRMAGPPGRPQAQLIFTKQWD